jgi:hypothetical protein
LSFRFSRGAALRDAGLCPQRTRGVPGKGSRDAEGTPHKPEQRPALHSTVVSRGGGLKGRGSKGEKQVPSDRVGICDRRARDDNGEGGAY